jgi:hypothetical protein
MAFIRICNAEVVINGKNPKYVALLLKKRKKFIGRKNITEE